MAEMSPRNHQQINTSDNTSEMSSIQTELEELENQLGRNSSNGAGSSTGRSVFRSINSALSSLRTRIERATNDRTSRSASAAAAAASTVTVATYSTGSNYTDRLMDRLRRAELAHSSRIPLEHLNSDITWRQSLRTNASSSHDNRTTPPERRTWRDDRTSSKAAQSESTPTSPRRESMLLASRRRVEELEDAHAYEQSRRIPYLTSTLDETDTVMEDREETLVSDDAPVVGKSGTEKVDDENGIPTILLTKKSRSSMDQLQHSVLFPERDTITELLPASTSSSILYSWGSGVQSLHDTGGDISMDDARVCSDSRAGRTDIVSSSVGEHHAACTTASGQVLIVGCNEAGEVDPGQPTERIIAKPFIMDTLNQARIVQVSCGFNHTAALHANGSVLTWGSNEYGQLGHHATFAPTTKLSFCRPLTMALGPARYATAVACGDGYTLCLTTRMCVLACGVNEITGLVHDKTGNNIPQTIPALDNMPLVGIAAGRRHAVVWTAHGSAFAWGENYFGACGREYPSKLTVPVPIKVPMCMTTEKDKFLPHPLSFWAYSDRERRHVSLPDDVAIIQASCGSNHTVLVTRSGKLLVCGANSYGQIGLDINTNEKVTVPLLLDHPTASRRFSSAAAGEFHTLLLDDFGDVWQMGGNTSESGIKQCLIGKAVRSISAGGNQNVAVAVRPGRTLMTRVFSDAIINSERFQFSGCVEELIDELSMSKDETNHRTDILTKIASSAEELFRTPSVLNSLFIDPTELDDLFTKVLAIDSATSRQTIVSAIERGIRQGIDHMRIHDSRLIWPEQVRFLLLYIQTPMFIDYKVEGRIFDRRGDLILSLCDQIINMPYEGYTALMCWATTIYPNKLFEGFLIKPLLAQLKKAMSVDAGAERRPIPAIVAVLRWLYNASLRAGNIVPVEAFYSDAIGNMHPQLLYKDLEQFKKAAKQKQTAEFSFCSYPFLFSPSTKRNLLQIENEMNMLKVAATGLTYNAEEQAFTFNPYYVLDIDREYLLTQTLQKIASAEPCDLRKKLRVVFKGEDGVDAGGVTREFFQLLANELFDFNTGMWSSRFQDGNITWFNSDCFWNDEGYYLSGILVGLAVYNSTLLDVHFPSAIYRKLLAQPLGLEDMVDEDIKHGLQQLLDYENDDVEDIFCLNFEVNWVDLGQEKTKELKPNGRNIPVTIQNKEEYVLLYVKWLLIDSIYPQYQSFEAGFMRVMEDSTMDLLHPNDLELLVVGTRELDFDALRQNTEYDGGYAADSAVILNFWRYVHSAAFEDQLNLLKFTTGSTRAPIGGLGNLKFKIQRAGPDSMNLPTSHTCFNTLLLPDYGDNYEKLTERMGRAILECEGFGLQ